MARPRIKENWEQAQKAKDARGYSRLKDRFAPLPQTATQKAVAQFAGTPKQTFSLEGKDIGKIARDAASYSEAQKKARAEEQAKAERDRVTNDTFGNDMAWLNDAFKENPTMLGKSARSLAQADPNSIAAQQKALDSLFGIAKDGGASAQERARRAGARNDSENWLRGQREADMENMSERGMSGSGAELLNLAKDRQDAAGRNSKADLETDAWLEQRALDAMQGAGDLGGKMRTSSFDESYKRGEGADDFFVKNADALNKAEHSNKDFMQRGYGQALQQRDAWAKFKAEHGIGVAENLANLAERENATGFNYAGGLATGDATQYNNARTGYNAAIQTPNDAATAARLAQQKAGSEGMQAAVGVMGDWTNFLGSAAMGGGGAGGAAGFSGAGGFTGGGGGGAAPLQYGAYKGGGGALPVAGEDEKDVSGYA